MGVYVNPSLETKEAFLDFNAREITKTPPDAFVDDGETAVVCLVEPVRLARFPSRPGEESECGNRHDREGWRCGA